ncbi:MAG: folylpolyglutamate synthase/dihydrofolate synthase family protein [Chthoniobacteraceae bacterium]
MNYAEALEWLYATQLHGIKLGLSNIQQLLRMLGIDPKRPKFLHVAGTNGKGSVCAMMDSIARAQGLKVGLFTSPHLLRFEERIRINGEPMPAAEVAAGLTRIRELVQDWEHHPTFFEIATALALEWFQQAATDVVVLETGLGGRLDSTNVVTPAVSVLTEIDLDHLAILGDTLEKVAVEKAGIIKRGIPTVSLPQQPGAIKVIATRADQQNSQLTVVDAPWSQSPVGLVGSHQKLNAALAVAALYQAGISLDRNAVAQGLAEVYWPGRFQQIDRIILDGAHNPSAMHRLVRTWHEVFGDEKPLIIFGALRDKDVVQMARILAPLAEKFLLVPTANPRTHTTDELLQIVQQAGGHGESVDSIKTALSQAKESATKSLVTGSLFLVGEALAILDGDSLPRETMQ